MDRRQFLQSSSLLGSAALTAAERSNPPDSHEWRHYGGDPGASRYSPLKQIDRDNVPRLKQAWLHHTGDSMERPQTTIECTPICVNGVLYLTTARVQTRALDAATGKVLWNFDPESHTPRKGAPGVSRGVCYWQDSSGGHARIFSPVKNTLYCLDAKTGELVKEFADGGALNLEKGLREIPQDLPFTITSPPVIYKDLLIVGGGGGEGPYPAAPGPIRAYSARTGKLRWTFHTIPRSGEFGSDTWPPEAYKTIGGANNWAGMSIDTRRGLVFVSTGSPAFDFYGGDRKGQNLFGNCVIALNAETGERAWHFQTVHHDLWDYDLPAQPTLVFAHINGRRVDAVAQVTKTGMLFLFDRQTGKPLFGIEERPVPASPIPGEHAWPTQPFPLKPPPFSRQEFTQEDITNVTPQSHAHILETFKRTGPAKIFDPPSFQERIVIPGYLGGALWGGCSFDPSTRRLFVNSSANSNLHYLMKAKADDTFAYRGNGYVRFFDHEGYPAIKPPWGLLTAIDLDSGEFLWQEILGEFPALSEKGLAKTGTLNIGGTIATAGGLVFIAATMDEKIRAFDTREGTTLWEAQLEAGGYATPCTYEAGGRQFIVIAAGGGGKPRTKAGDAITAFALPT